MHRRTHHRSEGEVLEGVSDRLIWIRCFHCDFGWLMFILTVGGLVMRNSTDLNNARIRKMPSIIFFKT
jgi:hypothetical protein